MPQSVPQSVCPLDPDPLVSARLLLGSVFHGRGVSIVITEVEAYAGEQDPASHAFRGLTKKNAVMFGPAGHLYTYSMHGHTCANVVCSPEGEARAVLIRAGRVCAGADRAKRRRSGATGWLRADHLLARGPGNLTKALGITMADATTDLFDPTSEIRLSLRSAHEAPPAIVAGPRVGVPRAASAPMRFFLAGEATVSAFRRSAHATDDPVVGLG